MDIYEFIGRRIKEQREREGLSQEALGQKLDVTANTISRWETATYKPRIEDLDRLARLFNISILEFTPEAQQQPNEPLKALLRAAQDLKQEDIMELTRFAEFRRAHSVLRGKRKVH